MSHNITIEGYLYSIYNPKFNNIYSTVGKNDIKHLTVTLAELKQWKPIINQLKLHKNKYTMSLSKAESINSTALNLKICIPASGNGLIDCIWNTELLYIPLNLWMNKLYKFILKPRIFKRPEGPPHMYYTLIEIMPV